MTEVQNPEEKLKRTNLLYRFDSLVKKVIPNGNARGVLYCSLIFAIVMYVQVWRIASRHQTPPQQISGKQETVIADDSYWNSTAYKEKIQQQTVTSFTSELEQWLDGTSQEFTRRKFEDILFINNGLTPDTGGDLSLVVPDSFNYLENHARARYQYAKAHAFLSGTPTLITHGQLVCDIDDKTEKATGIELYEWRYTSMTKLSSFMKTKPDWKVQVGDRILDVSDPSIEDKDILASRNAKTQPVGLFSFLIFREPQSNRIVLADGTILEKNGIDAKLSLARMSMHWDKQPKLYYIAGYEGCRQITNAPSINYGQSN